MAILAIFLLVVLSKQTADCFQCQKKSEGYFGIILNSYHVILWKLDIVWRFDQSKTKSTEPFFLQTLIFVDCRGKVVV